MLQILGGDRNVFFHIPLACFFDKASIIHTYINNVLNLTIRQYKLVLFYYVTD